MTGSVDQIEHIGLTILRLVVDAHGIGLDRDPALTLDIHGIEHLLFHVTVLNRPG